MSTYLLAGAGSAVAKATAETLQNAGHRVVGISRSDVDGLDSLHRVESYDFGAFPAIEGPIDGLVYFPGTINLKPFHIENDFIFFCDVL